MGRAGALLSLVPLVVIGALAFGTLQPIAPAVATTEQASSSDLVNALGSFPGFGRLPDSRRLDVPLVLEGTVSQLTGSLMAGAQVLLSAWPSNEKIRELPVGGRFELTPMARTVTDDRGHYALRAEATPLLRSLTDLDGLDIEIDVFHANRHYVHLSQVQLTGAGTWVRELTGLPDTIEDIAEGADNLLDLTLDRARAAVEQGLNVTGDLPVGLNYRRPTAPGCTPFEKVAVKRAMSTIATALARPKVTARVRYAKSSRTEVSTGAAFAGFAFAVNGTRSRRMGFSATFDDERALPGRTVNLEYQVEVLHAVARRSCARDFRGNEDVLHVTSPLGNTGGGRVIDSRYPAWTCRTGDPRVAEAGFLDVSTDSDRAKSYERAFTFEPIPGSGFAGSTLSGYSESVGVTFLFDIPRDPKTNKRLGTGFWCGDSNIPTATGQRVQGFQR